MDAQTRREKRQAKIKAGGANRLAQITKTTNPEAVDYKEPVDQRELSSNDEDPPESTLDAEPEQQQQQPLQTPVPPGQEDDPLLAMLQQLQASAGGGDASNMPQDPMADPMATFNSLFSGGDGDNAQQQPQQAKPVDTNDLFWQIAHTLGVFIVTVHSMMFNPSTLMYHFSILELILHSSRFLLERGSPPANSTLSTIAAYVPAQYKGYIIFVARYMRFGSLFIQDASLCLFFVGLCSLFRA